MWTLVPSKPRKYKDGNFRNREPDKATFDIAAMDHNSGMVFLSLSAL